MQDRALLQLDVARARFLENGEPRRAARLTQIVGAAKP